MRRQRGTPRRAQELCAPRGGPLWPRPPRASHRSLRRSLGTKWPQVSATRSPPGAGMPGCGGLGRISMAPVRVRARGGVEWPTWTFKNTKFRTIESAKIRRWRGYSLACAAAARKRRPGSWSGGGVSRSRELLDQVLEREPQAAQSLGSAREEAGQVVRFAAEAVVGLALEPAGVIAGGGQLFGDLLQGPGFAPI